MKCSIIIRVKNEQKNLSEVLSMLKEQTYQDFELVIVDDNSTDGSDKEASSYFPPERIQIVRVPKDKFSYPYACNLGAERAGGEYLVYISAHSFPISKTWLADGLSNFTDDKIAGVFAFPHAGKRGTIAERLLIDLPNYHHSARRIIYKSFEYGLLGNTNSILRKDLWQQYHFNESFTGGEDVDWAMHWTKKGYVIIHDPKFRVLHPHHLSFNQVLAQKRAWAKMVSPLKS